MWWCGELSDLVISIAKSLDHPITTFSLAPVAPVPPVPSVSSVASVLSREAIEALAVAGFKAPPERTAVRVAFVVPSIAAVGVAVLAVALERERALAAGVVPPFVEALPIAVVVRAPLDIH